MARIDPKPILPSVATQEPFAILGLDVSTTEALRAAVRIGLPYNALESVARSLEVAPQSVVTVLGISSRNLARCKSLRALGPIESNRLYRLARVVGGAVEVLGSLQKARLWLRTQNRALGGAVPLDLLDTEIGAMQVKEVLLRISFGIYS